MLLHTYVQRFYWVLLLSSIYPDRVKMALLFTLETSISTDIYSKPCSPVACTLMVHGVHVSGECGTKSRRFIFGDRFLYCHNLNVRVKQWYNYNFYFSFTLLKDERGCLKEVVIDETFTVHFELSSLMWATLQSSQVSTKPPLGRCIISRGATEAAVENFIETKIIFTGHSPRVRFERATRETAVHVREVAILKLPELYRGATASRVSTDVHILHRKAVAITKKFHKVQVAELAPDVIPVINWFLQVLEAWLVETAGCAPVCGTATKAFHSG